MISAVSGKVVTEFHKMILKFSLENKWATITKKESDDAIFTSADIKNLELYLKWRDTGAE